MASEEDTKQEEDDEQFLQAFGEHTGISQEVRDEINNIKNNDSDTTGLNMRSCDVVCFTDQARRLLGRYKQFPPQKY